MPEKPVEAQSVPHYDPGHTPEQQAKLEETEAKYEMPEMDAGEMRRRTRAALASLAAGERIQ